MNIKMQTNLKYRLIKKFPLSPEIGTIADFTDINTITDFGSLPSLKQEDCQDSEYWSPYVLTTDDGIDIYINENEDFFRPYLYGILKNQLTYTHYANREYLLKRYNNNDFQYLVVDEKLAKQKQSELELLEKTGQTKFKVNDLVYVIPIDRLAVIKTLAKEGISIELIEDRDSILPYRVHTSNELRHLTKEELLDYYSTQYQEGDIVRWFKLGEFTVEGLIYNEELQTVCIKGFYKNEDCSSIDLVEAPVKECFKRFSKEEKEMSDELKEGVKTLVSHIKNKYDIDADKIPRLIMTVADLITFVTKDYKVKGECEVSFDDGPSDL